MKSTLLEISKYIYTDYILFRYKINLLTNFFDIDKFYIYILKYCQNINIYSTL